MTDTQFAMIMRVLIKILYVLLYPENRDNVKDSYEEIRNQFTSWLMEKAERK